MTTGDLLVGTAIALWAAAAILTLWHNRRKGKNSCGCNCPGCSSGRSPNVIVEIEDSDSCCKKN